MLRIVSYNIQYGKRIKKIIPWLKKQHSVDVFCLQEFPKKHILPCMRELSHEAYGYRFTSSLRHGNKVFGEMTIYKKKRLHLISSSSLTLSQNRLDRISFSRKAKRSCLQTTFRLGRRTLRIVNVQLSCFSSNATRYAQLLHIIRVLGHRSASCIITGDFNMSNLLGRKKLFALMKKYTYETVTNRMSTHRLLIIRQQLDYLFIRKGNVRRLTVERIRLSDHYPILADVTLSK